MCILLTLSLSEARSLVDSVADVPHDEEAYKSAFNKLSAGVDATEDGICQSIHVLIDPE